MKELPKKVVRSVVDDIDEPLPVLGLLFGAFVLFGWLFDALFGGANPLVILLVAFVAVTLFIALIKYRE